MVPSSFGGLRSVSSAAKNSLVSTLRLSVATGESGPLVMMSGEADASNATELSDVIATQLASGAACLTVDAADLSFADSMAISVLTGAARALKALGGELVLHRAQSHLIRALTILGADQVLTIRQ